MPTKIGHFEILSELAKSTTGAVYKANDPQSNQTVALKAIRLAAFGERADELERSLIAEAESTKVLSHANLPPVYGAGIIDRQFCAAMEYIQGNSIATMLARQEGFSIWDLLDIGRQVCSGLDHARGHNIFHYSLEPAKIMCGWDGTVRILGYGVSSVGKFADQVSATSPVLHYMSPEQVRGEDIDARSNLFSLGAMFYEMVTDRKAFDGENPASLRANILAGTPVSPLQVNSKIHPGLSNLIMKTLAKNPAERYQSARELLDDLERCKEAKPQVAKPAAASTPVAAVPDAVKAATQAKFAAPAAGSAEEKPQAAGRVATHPVQNPVEKRTGVPPTAPLRAAAATAGGAGSQAASFTPNARRSPAAGSLVPSRVKPAVAAATETSASVPVAFKEAALNAPLAQAPQAQAPQAQAPKIAVDPLMAGGGPATSGVSFSEMTELPPLKEIYIPPPPPPAFDRPTPRPSFLPQEPEKPKIQTREVAQKAMTEIKNVPPRLMIYSIAGAAVIILIIAIALVLHVNSLNNDGEAPRTATASSSIQPAPIRPAAAAPSQVAAPQPDPALAESSSGINVVEPTRAAAAPARGRISKKKQGAPVAPIAIPGQMAIDSAPQGAQVEIDGQTDPSWVTPFTLPGLTAGAHSVTVSKPGYSPDTRTVEVTAGGKSFVVTHLTQLLATLAVSSSPPGANVYIDGKDIGKLTPAQVSADKGQHVILVRKSGFLDETTSAQFIPGQSVTFSPTLRSLGNVDDIKTVGKMKKLFGGKEAQGLSTISIKTQPKGAQVAVNQHMLDKGSPVDFTLDPGNYMVDITLTGYAPIHKVITVEKGGKAVIDEVMQRE